VKSQGLGLSEGGSCTRRTGPIHFPSRHTHSNSCVALIKLFFQSMFCIQLCLSMHLRNQYRKRPELSRPWAALDTWKIPLNNNIRENSQLLSSRHRLCLA
jgi:hypothetical protein